MYSSEACQGANVQFLLRLLLLLKCSQCKGTDACQGAKDNPLLLLLLSCSECMLVLRLLIMLLIVWCGLLAAAAAAELLGARAGAVLPRLAAACVEHSPLPRLAAACVEHSPLPVCLPVLNTHHCLCACLC
jgi:hypothetical protein